MNDVWNGGWLLVEADHQSGRKVWITIDPSDPTKINWRVTQDADASIAYNAEMEKASHGVRFGDYRLMGSIPLQLYHSSGLAQAHEEHDEGFVRRWFNDADNAKFRGSRGKF